MNVVVIDSNNLAGETDFPMLDLPKFGWQQYPALEIDDVAERCWRADVIVSVSTPVDQTTIDKAFKLQMIVAAGTDYDHIDLNAAQARGIKVCHIPGLDPADPGQSQQVCNQVVDIIDAFLRQEDRHRVV